MKRTIFLAITLLFLFSSTVTAGTEDTDNLSLTLTEAYSLAAANNRQAAIDDLEIEAKESAVKQAKENADTAGSSYTFEGALEIRVIKYVKPMEAEAALELAEISKKDNSKQLKQDIYNSFMSILLAQKELEIETKKLEFTKTRLEMAIAKYSINSITEQDVESAQYNLDSKINEIEAAQDKLKVLDIKLKDQMGLPLDGDLLVVEGVIEQGSFPEIDIDKVAVNNIDMDVNVYAAAGKLEAARKTMELTKELLKPGRVVYDDYLVNVEIALRDYENAKRSREINIRNTYNDLLNLRDNVELAVKYEELQLKILENSKIKNNKGQISKDAYITSEEQYLDAVYSKYKAICDLNIRKDEFLNMTRTE